MIQNKVNKLLEKSIISKLIRDNWKKIDEIILKKYPNIAKEYQYAINEDISVIKRIFEIFDRYKDENIGPKI